MNDAHAAAHRPPRCVHCGHVKYDARTRIGTEHAGFRAVTMFLEPGVTLLLIAFALSFGALAAAAWWDLRARDRGSASRGEAGGSFADSDKPRATIPSKQAEPLRVRICERQIYGRNRPQPGAAESGIDPPRASLRRARIQ